jgi:lipopolysaccharide/colanic/teichoic acid biosynthesis glycosyltransferase
MLRENPKVLLKGIANSGKSHAIYEAIGRALPRHRVILPKEPADGGSDPLTDLLSSRSPLRRRYSYVMVINDIDARLAAVGSLEIERWLRTHPKSRLIATVSAERWQELTKIDAGSSNASTARALSQFPAHHLSPEFHGKALMAAREKYQLPRGKTRLGEFLAEAEVTVSRLDLGARTCPPGRALALSAINCARAGLTRPIALSRLVDMSRLITSHDYPSTPFDLDDWDRAIGYCISESPETADLLHIAEEDEDPFVTPNPAGIEHADRHQRKDQGGTELPDYVWDAVIEIVADGDEDLLAIASAAASRGRPDLTGEIWQEIAASEKPGTVSQRAAQFLKESDLEASEGSVPGMLRRISLGPDPKQASAHWDRNLRPPKAGAPFDPSPPEDSKWRELYSHRILRDTLRFSVLLAMDVFAVLSGIFLARLLGTLTLSPSSQGHLKPGAALVAAVLVFLFFLLFGLYRSDGERARLGEIIKGVGLVAVSLCAIALGEGYSLTSLPLAALATISAVAIAYGLRRLYDEVSRRAIVRAKLQSTALLVCSEQPAAIASLLLASCRRPMRIVGYLAPSRRADEEGWLGTIGDFEGVARAKSIDRVIIADKSLSAEDRRDLIYRAHTVDLATELVPSPAELIQGATELLDEMLTPLIKVRPLYLTYVDSFTKRAIDVVLALLIGAAVAIPFAVLALYLRITGNESVFVRTLRPGLSSLDFTMFRLRTTEEGVTTRLGTRMERWRIDELPQLLNVLAGSMSIVGPRPIDNPAFEDLDEFQKARYVVRPGLTGLWQISRREHSLEEMTNLDLTYCRKWTPLLDLTILLRTVPAIVFDSR